MGYWPVALKQLTLRASLPSPLELTHWQKCDLPALPDVPSPFHRFVQYVMKASLSMRSFR